MPAVKMGSAPVSETMDKLLQSSTPSVAAPLDKGFRPFVLFKKAYQELTKDCTTELSWALKRADGVGRGSLKVFSESDDKDCVNVSVYMVCVLIQEMIWQRSGCELVLFGPQEMCRDIMAAYSAEGAYAFEVSSMPNVCGMPETPFKVTVVEKGEDLPAAEESPQKCGREANGCRLAFDLGKSDIKTVAVLNGEVLESNETEWDVTNPDPDYHYDAVLKAMQDTAEKAAEKSKDFNAKFPDAIGGSATGTVSPDNDATWCDIFPNVPPAVYKEKVVDIFKRLAKNFTAEGTTIPLKVINDGEVTALAAVQKIKHGNVMGISMGSSEGGGYANEDGDLLGWINELCYVRLDMNPEAPTDPWSKGSHRGLSHMYLGQRGATKLASEAGIPNLPQNYVYGHQDMCTINHENHAQCLKLIQAAMKDDNDVVKANVTKLYETIGVYLGYALAQYTEFYRIEHVMILGRVSKGKGGDIMLETAKKVLKTFDLEITFHTADEQFKAVGQCIAAAALPTIPAKKARIM